MKAVLCKAYGPPEKLVYEDTERAPLGPGDVRIRVRAAGVNFPDLLIIENKYQFKPPLPFAPGGEVAGDVIEVGAEAKGFSVGDRVIGMCGWNGFAEEVVVARDKALRMPEGMPYEVGTVLPTTYGTTVYASCRGHGSDPASRCSCTARRVASAPPRSRSARYSARASWRRAATTGSSRGSRSSTASSTW